MSASSVAVIIPDVGVIVTWSGLIWCPHRHVRQPVGMRAQAIITYLNATAQLLSLPPEARWSMLCCARHDDLPVAYPHSPVPVLSAILRHVLDPPSLTLDGPSANLVVEPHLHRPRTGLLSLITS